MASAAWLGAAVHIPQEIPSVKNISATLATVWRIAVPYFRSEDKWAGRGLLGVVDRHRAGAGRDRRAAQSVAEPVLQRAPGQRTGMSSSCRSGSSSASAFAYVALAVYKLYLNQWLQIRWRRWMTQHYLGEWLNGATHYRMQLKGDAADNPDQRITEDVKNFRRADARHRSRPAVVGRDAGLVHRHPLGPVQQGAVAHVRHRYRHPGLSGLVRAWSTRSSVQR